MALWPWQFITRHSSASTQPSIIESLRQGQFALFFSQNVPIKRPEVNQNNHKHIPCSARQ